MQQVLSAFHAELTTGARLTIQGAHRCSKMMLSKAVAGGRWLGGVPVALDLWSKLWTDGVPYERSQLTRSKALRDTRPLPSGSSAAAGQDERACGSRSCGSKTHGYSTAIASLLLSAPVVDDRGRYASIVVPHCRTPPSAQG